VKISIVTISFNQASFIEETIQSVINQRGIDLEYIVVDPGSTDGSREIIKKYADRIDKIIFEKDNGPADGLNKGFAAATGDIFGYLNADDILYPGALIEVMTLFAQYQNSFDVISGHGYVIDEYSRIRQKHYSNRLKNNWFHKKRYTAGYSILVQPSTFFTRRTFEEVKGFDTEYRIMWDAALTVDMLMRNKRIKVVNKFWSGFRVYGTSITGSGLHTNQLGEQTLEKLQRRAAIKNPIPKTERFALRYLGWILEPNLLAYRLIDHFVNRNRVI
jgi:glycosyltransferase involved in cell wall biosynthesis